MFIYRNVNLTSIYGIKNKNTNINRNVNSFIES